MKKVFQTIIWAPQLNINRRLIILIISISITQIAFAQAQYYTKQFIIKDSLFLLKTVEKANDHISYTLELGNLSKSFDIYNGSFEAFSAILRKTVVEMGKFTIGDISLVNSINTIAAQFFLESSLANRLQEETPHAGYLGIKKDIKLNPYSMGPIPCKKENRKDTLANIQSKEYELFKRVRENINILDGEKIIKKKEIRFYAQLSNKLMNLSGELDQTNFNDTLKEAFFDSILSIPAVLKTKYEKYDRRKLKKEINISRNENMILNNLLSITEQAVEILEETKQAENNIKKKQSLLESRLKPRFEQWQESLDALTKSLTLKGDTFPSLKKPFDPELKKIKSTNKEMNDLIDRINNINQLKTVNLSSAISNLDSIKYVLLLNTSLNHDYDSYSQSLLNKLETAMNDSNSLIVNWDSLYKNAHDTIDSLLVRKPVEKVRIEKLKNDTTNYSKKLNDLNSHIKELNNFKKLIDVQKINIENNNRSKKLYLQDINNISNEYIGIKQRNDSLKENYVQINKILSPDIFRIDSISIEFHMDFVKLIKINGIYNNHDKLEFFNGIPFPFSTIRNFYNLNRVKLVDKTENYQLNLTDVIDYDPKLYPNNENYCPADSVYTFNVAMEPEKIHILFKEKMSKLFDLRIYSDVKGFSADEPNGIIQVEGSKKVPMWNKILLKSPKTGFYFSIFKFYEPSATLSKIEQHNKYYFLSDTIHNPDTKGTNYSGTIRTIDLYKYSNVQFDLLHFNVINIDFSAIKTSIEFNLGYELLLTPIKDTLNKNKSAVQWSSTSGMPYLETRIQIKRDDRYGLLLSSKIGWLQNWDTKLIQYDDDVYDEKSENKDHKLVSFQLDFFVKPSKKSENSIFFRVNNTHNSMPWKLNYVQIQAGYSIGIPSIF